MDPTSETAHPIIGSHIVSTADVCGGKPRIANTRIRVQDVYVWHELRGQSPDEIVADFPHLSLADVHAALAFYYDNRELIQRQMREADELVQAMKARQGPGLLDRLNGECDADSVPPG
jgi:uncharacterized protein (DUF433 family)